MVVVVVVGRGTVDVVVDSGGDGMVVGTGSGVTQPLGPSRDGAGQAGAVTVVSLCGAVVDVVASMKTVVGVVDVVEVAGAAG